MIGKVVGFYALFYALVAHALTLENHTGRPIANVYIARHGAGTSWGSDILAGADLLVLVDSGAVNVDPGERAGWPRWDMRVVFADGGSAEWHAGVALAGIAVIRVYGRGSGIVARYGLK